MPATNPSRIVIDPAVQHGKPVIQGTRVTVARIVGSLAGGMSWEEVGDEYGVSAEDIEAALKYAAELIESEMASSSSSFPPLPLPGSSVG